MTQNLQKYGFRVAADYRAVEFGVGKVDFVGEGTLRDGFLQLAGEGELRISGEVSLRVGGSGRLHVVFEGDTYATIVSYVSPSTSLETHYQGVIAGVVRCTNEVHLAENAEYTEVAAIRVAGKFDVLTKVIHEGARSTSRLLSKVVVDDGARAIVRGAICITEHAAGSSGFERIDALLLGPTAAADVLPTIEVDTDDVSCKHGASVGSVDEEQLFYLAARGLTVAESKTLIAEGFLGEVCPYGRS